MGSLAKPQNRFKVDVNASENHLTGAAVVTDNFSIVVVEGGVHPTLNSRFLVMLCTLQGKTSSSAARSLWCLWTDCCKTLAARTRVSSEAVFVLGSFVHECGNICGTLIWLHLLLINRREGP